MAKKPAYEEAFEETNALYKQAILAASLQHLNFTILSDSKAKEIFKVVKASKILQYMTSTDIVIFINEKIFEQLEEAQRLIVVEESLAGITYDSENDTFEIKAPNVRTYKGILRKHTYATWEVVQESIETLYQVEKDEEKARKDALEAGKAKKKF